MSRAEGAQDLSEVREAGITPLEECWIEELGVPDGSIHFLGMTQRDGEPSRSIDRHQGAVWKPFKQPVLNHWHNGHHTRAIRNTVFSHGSFDLVLLLSDEFLGGRVSIKEHDNVIVPFGQKGQHRGISCPQRCFATDTHSMELNRLGKQSTSKGLDNQLVRVALDYEPDPHREYRTRKHRAFKGNPD